MDARSRAQRGILHASLGLAALLACSITSCSPRGTIPVGITRAELIASKGTPSEAHPSTIRAGAEIIKYPSGESVQVEEGKVLAVYRNPDPSISGEETLQYWRHRWKGKAQKESTVEGSVDPHGQGLRELKIVENGQGQSVVFEPQSGRVLRILTFEAR